MPANKLTLPTTTGANELNPLARKLVDLAFAMGGSKGRFYRAIQCNYVFPDGTPCFDKERASYNVNCPLCEGQGAYYEKPIDTPIVISDEPASLERDKFGVMLKNAVRVTVPIYIKPSITKVSHGGRVYVLRDKFTLYDAAERMYMILVAVTEAKQPFVGGPLFHTLHATTQYAVNEDLVYEPPQVYIDNDEFDALADVNADVLQENGTPAEEFPILSNENILTGEGKVTVIPTESGLLDDWE